MSSDKWRNPPGPLDVLWLVAVALLVGLTIGYWWGAA